MAARMKRRVGADNVAIVEPSEVSLSILRACVCVQVHVCWGRVWMAVRPCFCHVSSLVLLLVGAKRIGRRWGEGERTDLGFYVLLCISFLGLCDLKKQIYSFTVLEARGPKPRC